MNRKRTLVVLFVASLVATMAMVYLFAASMSEPPAANPADSDTAVEGDGSGASGRAGRRAPREPSPRSEEEQENLEDRLVMMLRSFYGDRISSTMTQILMAQVRTQVQTLFPLDWASRFPKILEKAFPGYSAKILATLANVDAFDRWQSASEDALAKLSPEEREKAIRAKKAELFGEQAAEELDAEARASEQRDQAMGETMRSLEESAGSIDQKLDVFTDALQKNYGDGPSAIALENGSMLSRAFFGLESVSRQLGALDPEARQEKINEIRRQFGYDDEQIAALEEDDREREADWQQGYAYMKERRALEQRLSGEELDQQIAALRQRYFGDVSHTIRLEEEEGFFRYERPRLYGRN